MMTIDSIVCTVSGQVSSELGGEIVILNLSDGKYYGLDNVGAYIWGLMQEPRSVTEIRDAVITEYEVESKQCTADVVDLIERLIQAELVAVLPSSADTNHSMHPLREAL
jgi:hypothetical protein